MVAEFLDKINSIATNWTTKILNYFILTETHSIQMRRIKLIVSLSLLISLISILMVVGFLILEVNFSNDNHDNSFVEHISVENNSMENNSVESPAPLNIVSRREWNAMNSSGSLDKLKLPVEKVILAHSITSECDIKARN